MRKQILKTETIALRVSAEIKEWMEKEANKRGLSVSEYLRWLLISYMTQQGYDFGE